MEVPTKQSWPLCEPPRSNENRRQPARAGLRACNGVAYRSQSAILAPQMLSAERPRSRTLAPKGFVTPDPRLFSRREMFLGGRRRVLPPMGTSP